MKTINNEEQREDIKLIMNFMWITAIIQTKEFKSERFQKQKQKNGSSQMHKGVLLRILVANSFIILLPQIQFLKRLFLFTDPASS